MKHVVQDRLAPELLRPLLDDPSCGAVCIFEGRVRDHHEGKAVTAVEYEAYAVGFEEFQRG